MEEGVAKQPVTKQSVTKQVETRATSKALGIVKAAGLRRDAGVEIETRTVETRVSLRASKLENLRSQAEQALRQNHIHALRRLSVQRLDNDSLIIQGVVSSFYHKQLAQEAIRSLLGNFSLVNSVEVSDS